MAPPLSLTYSLADQSFARTKSIGILNVSLDLLQTLAQRKVCTSLKVLANRSFGERLPALADVEYHDRAADSGWGRLWWDQVGVYSAAQRSGNEWLFLPKGFASFSRRCPVRLATLIHDVMQDHYDRNYPGSFSSLETGYFRSAFAASIRQSEVVFVPSEFTLQEIKRVAADKGWKLPRLVRCGEGFFRANPSPGIERRDMVVLVNRFPHKLTRRAVDYMSRWCQTHSFAEQVHWIGILPDKFSLPSRPGWHHQLPLPETEFRSLLSRARVVLFFSDYEGFGRPPVKATLAGACPVFSDIPATREVMGHCGRSFENSSYESFATALNQALATTPQEIEAWANELAARHDWNLVVDRIVTALAEAGNPTPS